MVNNVKRFKSENEQLNEEIKLFNIIGQSY